MTANKQPRSRISWTSFRAPNPALILAGAFLTALVSMPAQAKIKVLYTFTGERTGDIPPAPSSRMQRATSTAPPNWGATLTVLLRAAAEPCSN